MGKTLVIVPCGLSKIWDKAPDAGATLASRVYTGQLFKFNKRYAELLGDEWVILSAKYGFISPNFLIPYSYDVTFKKKSTKPVSLVSLKKQIKELELNNFEEIIGLGGKEYRFVIEESFGEFGKEVKFPFAGLAIGKMLQAIKQTIE